MDRIGIENLSTFGLLPVQFIHLAADLGCGHVSLNLRGSANRMEPFPAFSLADDPALRRRVGAACRERGVCVSLIEGFAVLPDREEEYARDLDSAAELGARAICAVSMDRDAGVIDASVFPHITSGNTQAPTLALAWLAAERIAATP